MIELDVVKFHFAIKARRSERFARHRERERNRRVSRLDFKCGAPSETREIAKIDRYDRLRLIARDGADEFVDPLGSESEA